MISSKEFEQILEKRLSGKRLTETESVALIQASILEEKAQEIISAASRLNRPHKDKVFALPPLYVNSGCENHCLYCNFRETGEKLSLDEFRTELEALLEKGYRSIELVFGQDSELFCREKEFNLQNQKYNLEKLIPYISLARKKIDSAGKGMLVINAPPVDLDSYHQLKDAGVDVMLLWAETFNPMQYWKLHPGETPKTEQRFRLEAYQKAKTGGLEHLAGTFLKGLYDWRVEECLLTQLDKEIGGFSIIGTPRYKGRKLEPIKDYQVSDEEYLLNIALDLLIYSGIIWLQTRESWRLNEKILDTFGGGFILTLDCSTAPGGYAGKKRGKEQFPVHSYQPEIIVPKLKDKNIQLVYDWGLKELRKMQR